MLCVIDNLLISIRIPSSKSLVVKYKHNDLPPEVISGYLTAFYCIMRTRELRRVDREDEVFYSVVKASQPQPYFVTQIAFRSISELQDNIHYAKMAPTPPQSAYHLYFRFYKNVALRPSLRIASIRGDKTNKEVYKNFVQTVLDADLNDGSFDGDAVQQRYFGNDSFSGMSKQISKKWREVDELTRSIFKELAAEDSERYKKVSSFRLI